jgi:hypothetical protein
MPKLIITLLQNGRGFAGKQTLIKEYSLFAKANVSAKEVGSYKPNSTTYSIKNGNLVFSLFFLGKQRALN